MNKSINSHVPVVILCGGKGARLREETEYRPKPLIKIGQMPILWHIMKIYSFYGFKNFILLLGYRGEMIKNYFLNFEVMVNDFTLKLRTYGKEKVTLHNHLELEDWDITFVDTKLDTPTGGRIKKAEKYLKPFDRFMATYGDGVADIDVNKLYKFHLRKKTIGTLSGVQPASQFGVVEVKKGMAKTFKEKPRMRGFINGGFFVFEREFLKMLKEDSVLEQEPLKKLSAKQQLSVYKHTSYWQCMDTFKQAEWLNKAWDNGDRSWAIWERGNEK